MFKSQNWVGNIFEVPQTWIFENYLNLPFELDGFKVKINSIFNDKDTRPSMFIYLHPELNEYKFKCFSSGEYGSAIDMMMKYWNKSFHETSIAIMSDYMSYLKTNNKSNIIESQRKFNGVKSSSKSKWIVSDTTTRKWNTYDKAYWMQYQIGSKSLRDHDVYALKNFEMSLVDEDGVIEDSFVVNDGLIYGYFNKENLAKIYQPLKKQRFIKVSDYILGFNQIQNKDYLIITSSLKDIISLKLLKLNVDSIAPHSENTLLSETIINEFKEEYKAIVVFFDSDDAGKRAMSKYKEVYNIPMIYVPLEKDVSDMIKIHGKKVTIYNVLPKINKALNNYEKTI